MYWRRAVDQSEATTMVWESSYWLEETGGGPLTNQRLLLWKGRVLINWKKLAAIYTWKVLYPGPGVDSSDCPLAEDDRLYFSPRLHKNNILFLFFTAHQSLGFYYIISTALHCALRPIRPQCVEAPHIRTVNETFLGQCEGV